MYKQITIKYDVIYFLSICMCTFDLDPFWRLQSRLYTFRTERADTMRRTEGGLYLEANWRRPLPWDQLKKGTILRRTKEGHHLEAKWRRTPRWGQLRHGVIASGAVRYHIIMCGVAYNYSPRVLVSPYLVISIDWEIPRRIQSTGISLNYSGQCVGLYTGRIALHTLGTSN